MNVTDYIKHNITYLDGGLGSLLQFRGLTSDETPVEWNITHKNCIKDVHKAYFDAGSNIVNTNTFSLNRLRYAEYDFDRLNFNAFENINAAKNESAGNQRKFIAYDLGPSGKMLYPYGKLEFNKAVELFSANAKAAEKYGADLVFIETMNDIGEARAALLAVKENTSLPVFVSLAYSENGKLLTGTSPSEAVLILEALGADAIGVNCSFGPDRLLPVIEEYCRLTSLPIIFKPNAGLPKITGSKTVYDVSPSDFAQTVKAAVCKGAGIIGGCCGTTPEHISETVSATADMKPITHISRQGTVICSSVSTVEIGKKPIIVGERINPTGRRIFREAIENKDYSLIYSEAVKQDEAGADVLDVNTGAPGTDESETFRNIIPELQGITDLPLQIDTSDTVALETALRLYNGKALINSVNGKAEAMAAVFPLAKKYGGTVIALLLDENGIPTTAEARLRIAEKILSTAEKYGINKDDIIFDALVMSVSADINAAATTLETVRLIKERLGCRTILGVSNVSFGLPERDLLNSTFLTSAFNNGLDCAIANPCSQKIMSSYRSYCALLGYDSGFKSYISFAENSSTVKEPASDKTDNDSLIDAIVSGLKEKAGAVTEALLKSNTGNEIVNGYIIPALDKVGRLYEENKIYLPNLLMSAESAKASFEILRKHTHKSETDNGTVILATVEGDIHDIGKNIVKLLLENYGFNVLDLGMNVPPEAIKNKLLETNAPIVGLSALMTTTLPAMKKTVELIKACRPNTAVIVGGAVLTEAYAKSINADYYASNAMTTVEISRKITAEI